MTTVSDSETGLTITVPASAGLQDASNLVESLRALPEDAPLVFEAADVEIMSTPYVLAIVSALNTREAQTPPAAVVAAAAPFIDAFSDLGFFQEMMKMEFRT